MCSVGTHTYTLTHTVTYSNTHTHTQRLNEEEEQEEDVDSDLDDEVGMQLVVSLFPLQFRKRDNSLSGLISVNKLILPVGWSVPEKVYIQTVRKLYG